MGSEEGIVRQAMILVLCASWRVELHRVAPPFVSTNNENMREIAVVIHLVNRIRLKQVLEVVGCLTKFGLMRERILPSPH